ncbi:unnamed protein product [Fraxinus pennsylvanica]|uniref:Uncharacterized protein n=1 Tax=Fraxinus pennsylvanica TaxID=56036 RepID=A0AAD2E6N5_9LAMI|nr:unnamed protein product [Fraxinus pennsylvanica]
MRDNSPWEAFEGLRITVEGLKVMSTPFLGFGGATVIPIGVVELPVMLGTYPGSVVILTNLLECDLRLTPVECCGGYSLCLSQSDEIPNQSSVGAGLEHGEKEELVKCLSGNLDVFAWCLSDIQGIDPSVAQHCLGVLPGAKLIKQKKRNLASERQAATKVKADKLLQAGFIREVQYPEWLANVVLAKKPNEKWRMCADYTGLSKVCPKDLYPLPRIDHLVEPHRVMTTEFSRRIFWVLSNLHGRVGSGENVFHH